MSTILKSLFGLSCAVLVLFFNNCKGKSDGTLQLDSSSFSNSTENQGSGATGTKCEQDIKNLYARGWQQFLKTNCTTCHSNGPGKGRFANADLETAYNEFQQAGYTKVARNAVNSSHNPPYTGVQHIQKANELKLEWLKGLQDFAKCTGDASYIPEALQIEKITLKTKTPKVIGAADDGVAIPITFDLNTDLIRTNGTDPLPSLPGGKFTIYVTRLKNAGGFSYYTFSSPKIHNATVDSYIEGIFININGLLLNYPTTFSFVKQNIRRGTTNDNMGDLSGLISTGSLVAPKVILPTDTLTISFIDIKKVDLPPPPPPSLVNFLGSSTVVVTPGTNYIDMALQLSNAAAEPIVVTVSEENNLCGTVVGLTNSNTQFAVASATCLPEVYNTVCPGNGCNDAAKKFGRARSVQGATYNRFDWDFKMPADSVTFGTGESVKTLRIYFSKDIRYEENRVLSFNIDTILGKATIGTNKTVNYVINKYLNPIPDPNILTFSQLMNTQSGILGQSCVKCHNSTDTAGGYNMTDHQMMVDRKVLIPGDRNSKMYVRMHPTPEFLAKPMPQDGFLTQPKVLEVEKWILDGAKNN
jgi:hypothetical protein